MPEIRAFNYPADYHTLPGYDAKRGKKVEVLGEASPDESDHHCDPNLEKLYRIRDPEDGWVGYAWESEIERE